ncbi:MAG: polyprenol monophosphomannose synthase [Thermodesulfobacteriota bacterium]|nr:MAG: polyprenol monophosphomannose synthase [Thermodesulfobacteriota bacterium]
MPKGVTVVLPTYNERENIGKLVRGILDSVKADVEIIVVDDDSKDLTWKAVEDMNLPSVRVIRRVGENGLTSAIKRGIDESRNETVVWMDADLSMPPEKINDLLACLESRDIAIGSRYVPGGRDMGDSMTARFMSRLLGIIAKTVLNVPVNDMNSGFVATKKRIVKELGLRGDYGEYCLDFLYRAHKKGYSIAEAPYVCVPRLKGVSKTATGLLGFFWRGRKYIYAIMKLRLSRI